LDLPRWEGLKYLAKERIAGETWSRLTTLGAAIEISREIEEHQAALAVWLTKIHIVE
jgi:hypothetical protein